MNLSGSGSETVVVSNHLTNMSKNLWKFVEREQFCDVALVAMDGWKIHAHRVVLSSVSEYFHSMLSNGFKEEEAQEIHLKNVSSDIIKQFVEFSYTGSIVLNNENVQNVAETANMWMFNDVAEACTKFIVKNMSPLNCLGINDFAEHQNMMHLVHESYRFAKENFDDVRKSDEFVDMSFEKLKSFLEDDDLNVDSEEDVFISMMFWVNHNKDERKLVLPQLLRCIRFPQMRQMFFKEKVEKILLENNSETLLVNYLKWNTSNYLCSNFQPPTYLTRRNVNNERLLILGGSNLTKYPKKLLIEYYCMSEHLWQIYSEIDNFDRTNFAAIEFNDLVILAGGLVNGSATNIVQSYSLSTDVLSDFAPMNHKRNSFCLIVLKGILYAVGGGSNAVERYDPVSSKWEIMAPMSISRTCFGAVVLYDQYIYAIGGLGGSNCMSSVERYEPKTNKWKSVKSSMLVKRYNFGVGILNDNIYVVGGVTNPSTPDDSITDSVEMYIPSTNKWTEVHSLPIPLRGVSVCSYRDNLYVAGGDVGHNHMLKIAFKYNKEEDTWAHIDILNYERCAAQMFPFKIPGLL